VANTVIIIGCILVCENIFAYNVRELFHHIHLITARILGQSPLYAWGIWSMHIYLSFSYNVRELFHHIHLITARILGQLPLYVCTWSMHIYLTFS